VIGNGPDHSRLVKIAGARISFLTKVDDEEISRHFRRSAGFIFPGVDDFGVVAVEALASGTPVIALEQGGALDYIKPGQNGVFFKKQTADDLVEALKNFNPAKFDAAKIIRSAAKFAPAKFDQNFKTFINSLKVSKK
jgi:glycosyltransferase involved in cell wall biosynthesis